MWALLEAGREKNNIISEYIICLLLNPQMFYDSSCTVTWTWVGITSFTFDATMK